VFQKFYSKNLVPKIINFGGTVCNVRQETEKQKCYAAPKKHPKNHPSTTIRSLLRKL